jgi:tryptophan synthase beta chain
VMNVAPRMKKDELVAICLSGRGDKDVYSVAEYLGEKL